MTLETAVVHQICTFAAVESISRVDLIGLFPSESLYSVIFSMFYILLVYFPRGWRLSGNTQANIQSLWKSTGKTVKLLQIVFSEFY